MSAMTWAKTVRCDWPDCQSEAEVILGSSQWTDRVMPAGWIDLALSATVLPVHGKGLAVREICSIHTAASLAAFAQVFGKEPAAND